MTEISDAIEHVNVWMVHFNDTQKGAIVAADLCQVSSNGITFSLLDEDAGDPIVAYFPHYRVYSIVKLDDELEPLIIEMEHKDE